MSYCGILTLFLIQHGLLANYLLGVERLGESLQVVSRIALGLGIMGLQIGFCSGRSWELRKCLLVFGLDRLLEARKR